MRNHRFLNVKDLAAACALVMMLLGSGKFAHAQQTASSQIDLIGLFEPLTDGCHGPLEDTLQENKPNFQTPYTNYIIPKGFSFSFQNFEDISDASGVFYILGGKKYYTYANATIYVLLAEFDGVPQQIFTFKLDSEGRANLTVKPSIVLHGINVICATASITPAYPVPIGKDQPPPTSFMKFYASGIQTSSSTQNTSSPEPNVTNILENGVQRIEKTSQDNWNVAQQSMSASNQTYEQKEAAINSNMSALQAQLQEQQTNDVTIGDNGGGAVATADSSSSSSGSSLRWVDMHADARPCVGTSYTSTELTFTNKCSYSIEILWGAPNADYASTVKVILPPGGSGDGLLPCFGAGCSKFSGSIAYVACPFDYTWVEKIVNTGDDPSTSDGWTPAGGTNFECMRRE